MSPSTTVPFVGDRPTVFVSYSHLDETWKDRVVKHLRVLEPGGVLEVWHDRRISGGDDWLAEIHHAMDRASVAVLLISADFLNSRFILDTEVPYLLNRQRRDGVRIVPVIVRPCPWTRVDWLSAIQCRPKDGKPLSGGSDHQVEEALTALTLEIQDLLGTAPKLPGLSLAPRLDLGRMPTSGREFVGREAELERLDVAWEDPGTHVVTLVAFGGVGKSTLVNRWLDRLSAKGWPDVRRALDWSFYSQGTEERVASADRFLDHALRAFGDSDPSAGSPRDRGLRLAELVRRERTLLVLDGIEPLQHPPNHPLAGRLKDPALAALLKGLAAHNPGLCFVTTREHITDLDSFTQTAPQWDLEDLGPEAGGELLRHLGVKGNDLELRAAAEELGGHALALTLFGNYLRRVFDGDVRRRKEVNLGEADERQGGHAFRVIHAYANWLGEGPELAILRLLGLFDRPADPAALAALRAEPVISGLTDAIVDLSEEDWCWIISSLREHGLLLPADPQQPGALDAHPLLRSCFQEELEREWPEGWREGNLRLYDHLTRAAPDFPESMEEMEPLIAAVVHGCRAGRQQKVFFEVFWLRIRRGQDGFNWKRLGAYGSDLTAVSGFFDDFWNQPSANLTPKGQSFFLNEAGFDLRALGRLTEAVQPIQHGLAVCIAQEDWRNAATNASNLSELTLTLGNLRQAVAFGEQSVWLADRSADRTWQVVNRAVLADALHQAGRWKGSVEIFREAEALQMAWQPECPRLYSLSGYRYCDLLLSQAEPKNGASVESLAIDSENFLQFNEACSDVLERARQALVLAEESLGFLDKGFDRLSLGRAYLGLALTKPRETAETDLAHSIEHLNRAVADLRQAGREDCFPRGLLARVTFHRLQNNPPAAVADLTEALEIAERGPMRLHMCDAHIEWARLCLQQGDTAEARRHVTLARKLVDETGYGRREREVAYLERRLAGEG